MPPLNDVELSVANARLFSRYCSEAEWRKYQLENVASAAETLKTRYSGLLAAAGAHYLDRATFAGHDGYAYSIRETLRACLTEIHRAIKHSGPGIATAERDLPLIDRAISRLNGETSTPSTSSTESNL